MNKTMLKQLLLTSLFLCSISLWAQQRSIDMEVLITSPAQGSVYQDGDAITFALMVKNNGPDGLVTGDTLVAIMPDGQGRLLNLTEDIPVGDSLQVFEAQFTTNVDETSTMMMCVQMLYDPSTQASMDGQPLVVTYIDPDSTNNAPCHEVTIELDDGTAIGEGTVAEPTFQPYPNPATDKVYIPLDVGATDEVTIIISDMFGRTVLEKRIKAGSLSMQDAVLIPLAGWGSGIYYIIRWQGQSRSVGKIVVKQK